jgi:hopene-associated glycosyltransferase HpnB
VIPARNEAEMLPLTLPTLLGQDYQGQLSIVLVDDDSSDGTGAVAAAAGRAAGWQIGSADRPEDRVLQVLRGAPTPDGWAGKVWAMSQGVPAAGQAELILFTDADIAFAPGAVAALAAVAVADDLALVSQMALLRAATGWERLLIPAFVYFFAQLYPFPRVSRTRSRTAAAAGGCMLVRAASLAAAGGMDRISSARIDDVALGRLLKRSGGRCWLSLTTEVVSVRPYLGLADIWGMVARSAYTQLRYSVAAVTAAVAGLAWLYLLPPAAAVAGVAALAAGGGGAAVWLAAAGLAGWALMTVSYLPMLRLYQLSPLRGPTLPVIAALYAAMTADSARRHLAGHGGEWKGRVINP